MIFETFDDLNWLAVVVAAGAWFVFSAIWYSVKPLSGAWQRAARVDMNEGGGPLPMILVATFVLYVVIAAVIALLVRATGTTEITDGIALGVALGLAFGLASALVNQLYEKKGGSYYLINGVNAIIAYTIVSVIVTAWD